MVGNLSGYNIIHSYTHTLKLFNDAQGHEGQTKILHIIICHYAEYLMKVPHQINTLGIVLTKVIT